MPITASTRIVGLFGDPVSHSLSPAMHNAAFAERGLDWVYVAFHVLPERLADAVRALPALGLAGVNVTIPHKETVIPHLDELSRTAAMIGAVNTIRVEGDGRLTGHNTDAPGFAAALTRKGVSLAGQRLLLLGGGGAARAVAFQAAIDGAEEITVCDLAGARAAALASDVASHFASCRVHCIPLERDALAPAIAAATVLVNATPVGMAGRGDYPIDLAWLHPALFVYDLVYNPTETPLLAAARARAIPCDNGLTMLALQGAASFALWTGEEPPGESMIATLKEAVAPANLPAPNLILVGFMGAGKTIVGRRLAARLHWDVVDCDDLIEARAGKTISAIFADDGEAAFRDLEEEVATRLADYRHTVITTGGGIVERETNLARLHAAGRVVYLRARPESLYARVKGASHRPLLQVDDPLDRIRELLARRAPRYERADQIVDTDGLAVEEVVEAILR